MSYDFEGDPNTVPVGVRVDEGMKEERFNQLQALCNKEPLSDAVAAAQNLIEECLREISRLKRIVEAENAGIMQALAEMDKANYLTIVRERDQVYAELKVALDAGTALPVELIAQAKKWRSLAKGAAEQIHEERKRHDKMTEAMPHFCEHANEVPQRCPCMSVCYCRQAGNTCASEG